MNFTADDRGVSGVVGFVLILGIIVILLAIFQAQGVPAQNSQVEFDHSITVGDDLQELRSAQVTAASDGSTISSSVKLGVSYPARVLFINPPDARGRLETSIIDNGTYLVNGKTMKQACGFGKSVKSKAIEYSINYNYFSESNLPPYTLENSVLYENLTGGQRIINSNQTLVSGDTVHLFVVTSNFSESAVEATSVDFHATTGSKDYENKLNISIPTRLSKDQWSKLIPAGTVVDQSGDRVRIETESTTLRCSAIGIGEAPSVTPSGAGGADEINPAAPGDIQLIGYRQGSQSSGAIELQFRNRANSSINITEARVNFFKSDKKEAQEPDQVRIYNGTDQSAGVLPINADFQDLDPVVFFPANGTHIIRVDLEDSNNVDTGLSNVKDGWFVVTARYETGEYGTYFIPVPDKGTF